MAAGGGHPQRRVATDKVVQAACAPCGASPGTEARQGGLRRHHARRERLVVGDARVALVAAKQGRASEIHVQRGGERLTSESRNGSGLTGTMGRASPFWRSGRCARAVRHATFLSQDGAARARGRLDSVARCLYGSAHLCAWPRSRSSFLAKSSHSSHDGLARRLSLRTACRTDSVDDEIGVIFSAPVGF